MKKFAVIVAAGSGVRMGNSVPKQFLLLKDNPVLWYSLNAFLKSFDDLQIILVVAEKYIQTSQTISESTISPERIKIITGGDTRFHSVKNGLTLIDDDSIVFVHDGVRCMITQKLIARCYDEAFKNGNAIPSVKPVDSIRVETHHGNAIIDRDKIHIIQTPQTFRGKIIKAAFEQVYQESFTDEASVIEMLGEKINLVEGETTNIKITQPFDLVIAENILTRLEL